MNTEFGTPPYMIGLYIYVLFNESLWTTPNNIAYMLIYIYVIVIICMLVLRQYHGLPGRQFNSVNLQPVLKTIKTEALYMIGLYMLIYIYAAMI